jgi:hypothetical protein
MTLFLLLFINFKEQYEAFVIIIIIINNNEVTGMKILILIN